jgi:microcompartment protein CcmK/EutM
MAGGVRNDLVSNFKKEMYKLTFADRADQKTVYDQIYKVRTDVIGAGDKEDQLLGAGNFVRHTAEYQNIEYNHPTSGWSFLTKYYLYSDGLQLSYEEMEDSIKVKNLIKVFADSWDESLANEMENFAALPFNNGGDLLGHWVFNGTHTGQNDSSGNLMYDGLPLFNESGNLRTSKGGGTYYNSVVGISLSFTNLQTIYTLMTATNNRTELDRVTSNRPDTLLTQSGDDEFTAWALLNTMGESQSKPGGSMNDRNPFSGGSFVGKLTHIAWDYLDDTGSPFYLGKRQHKSFEFHKRQRPKLEFHQDPTNKSFKADMTFRMGILIKDWRTWHRGGGTAA